jgi:hypothetical protein
MKSLISIFNQFTAWMRKDTDVMIRNSDSWGNDTFFQIKMATPCPQTKITSYINKDTNIMTPYPEVSGSTTIGGISTDIVADIVDGISNWVDDMDVYIRIQRVNSRGDALGRAILICVTNPTVGCPWLSMQRSDDSSYYVSQSLYENQSVGILDAFDDNTSLNIARQGDTDVKNWKIDIFA